MALRSRLIAAATLAGCMALATSACSAIPTSGPVHTAAVSPSEGVDDVLQYAQDPIAGGSPEVILDGFVQAMAVGANEPSAFGTANKFLTSDAAATWKSSQVLIYRAETNPRFRVVGEGRIDVVVDSVGAVDGDGRYTESPPRPRTLEYGLKKVAGEWRIDKLPDIVVTSEPVFERIYQLAPVYFPDTSTTSLVYEARYFPRARVAQSVVRALFNGPPPWLAPAVHNPVPTGATVGSVVVTDGVAEVNLGPVVQVASPKDRQLIAAQIEASLRLVDIGQVRLLVNNQDFTVDRPLPTLSRSVAARSELYFVDGDRLVSSVESLGGATPVAGVAKLGKQITSPAVRHDGERIVALDTHARLVQLLPAGEKDTVLLKGTNLIAPSFDIHGWIWTAESGGTHLIALTSPTNVARLNLSWLAGREIVAVQPARDGVRLAIVVKENQGTSVYLVAVTREGDGRPLAVGKPQAFASGQYAVSAISWLDDGAIAAIGSSSATSADIPLLLGAGSLSTTLPSLPGTPVGIAAGRYQDPNLLVVTDNGTCYARLDTRWEMQGTEVSFLTFSG